MRIRTARRSDLPLLQDIERAAGEPFRTLGMIAVADDDPPPLDLLDGYRRAGRAWVAVDGDDRPAGYLIADPVDGAAHIEQVSVHPTVARRGLGSTLIDHLAGWAADARLDALTLTTFSTSRGTPRTTPASASVRSWNPNSPTGCGRSGRKRRNTAWTAGRESACAARSRAPGTTRTAVEPAGNGECNPSRSSQGPQMFGPLSVAGLKVGPCF